MALVPHKPSEDELRKLMPPPPPRPRDKVVVEEDLYVSTIEAIIERDFFPDVPKMQNQLEWLQAVSSGDPARMKQAQINIARRRAGLKTPANSSAPLTDWATPGTGALNMGTPSFTPGPAQTPQLGATPVSTSAAAAAVAAAGAAGHRAPKVSLDQYLATHTSEDNHSFLNIVEEDQRRKRLKYGHHLEDKNKPLALIEQAPRPTDEYGTSGQPTGTLVLWKHTPHNNLYYNPKGVALSAKEVDSSSVGPPKQLLHSNTRMSQAVLEEVSAPAPLPGGVVGGAGGQGGPGPAVLATPALTPALADESPFMTWGDIESTPLRLDGEDLVLEPGPTFRISDATKREQAGRALAQKAAVQQKARRGTTPQLLQTLRRGHTPSGQLTPAGQKLAGLITSKHKKTEDSDKQLRASYAGATPTPGRLGSATPGSTRGLARGASTPLLGATPKAVAQVVPKAKANNGVKESRTEAGQSVTDNLLHI